MWMLWRSEAASGFTVMRWEKCRVLGGFVVGSEHGEGMGRNTDMKKRKRRMKKREKTSCSSLILHPVVLVPASRCSPVYLIVWPFPSHVEQRAYTDSKIMSCVQGRWIVHREHTCPFPF
jgi:hypothetical protein